MPSFLEYDYVLSCSMAKHRLPYMIRMKFHTKNKHNVFTCPKNADLSKNNINFEDPKIYPCFTASTPSMKEVP